MRSLAVHPGMAARNGAPIQMGGAVTWRYRQRSIMSNYMLYVAYTVVFSNTVLLLGFYQFMPTARHGPPVLAPDRSHENEAI